jgi:hypothetical protein
VHHHPLIITGAAWWALLSVTVRLDPSALIVGLLPTIAVVVNYVLAKRRADQIARDAAAKIGEVHVLVNSQRTDLENQIKDQALQIQALNDRLAALPPPEAA